MNTITGMERQTGIRVEKKQSYIIETLGGTVSEPPKTDSADIPENWQEQMDWQAQTNQLLNHLQKSFPSVQILYSGNIDQKTLANLAASLGKGSHLLLSEDFIQQMGSSAENFEKGKNILMNALNSLAQGTGKAAGKGIYLEAEGKFSWTLQTSETKKESSVPKTTWEQKAEETKSILDRMKQSQEDAKKRQEQQKKFRKAKNASNYRTAGTYAKLASAGSKTAVNGVMSEARRKIANLRSISAIGDTEERMKARAAIRSYQTLLARGGRKIRRLNEEELTRLRRKQAERKAEMEKALRHKQEQNMQKVKRRSADRMLVEEGRLNDMNQFIYGPHSRNKYRYDDKDDATESVTLAVPAAAAAIAVASAEVSAGAAEFTAADVTITVE